MYMGLLQPECGDNDILISAVYTRTSNKRIETRFIFCKKPLIM